MKKVFRLILLSLIVISGLNLFSSDVFAKKVLPFLQTTKKSVTTSSSRGVTASVKFRGDRRAIIVNISNLGIAKKVEYFLSYTSRGTTQGASGTIANTTESSVSRELLFGSCSKGVCRYDTGITNAKFVVTTYLLNGKKVIKSFKLRV